MITEVRDNELHAALILFFLLDFVHDRREVLNSSTENSFNFYISIIYNEYNY